MKRWARTRPIRQIVVHVNVGPETPGTSGESLGRYLDSITGGYHHVHDDDSTLTLARDDQCVAGARGGDCNEVAIHHCIIGRADQSAAQWADRFSVAAVERCAVAVAKDCVAHNLNAVRIVGEAIQARGRTGICGHGDVSRAWSVQGGHTDPGPAFPWGEFVADVQARLGPPAGPWPDEWSLDVAQPGDVIAVLSDAAGTAKLKADGAVVTVSGPFWGSYFSIPAGSRLGVRHFVAITRRGVDGYTIWGHDGSRYDFGPDIKY